MEFSSFAYIFFSFESMKVGKEERGERYSVGYAYKHLNLKKAKNINHLPSYCITKHRT